MQQSGLAHLCHHNAHWEYCYSFDERVVYIKAYKPAWEQEARLKWFAIIPDVDLPGKGSLEWQAYVTAGQAYVTARRVYGIEWQAYEIARSVTAWQASETARQAYVEKFAVELEVLHTRLFPGCPWNEETMFPQS